MAVSPSRPELEEFCVEVVPHREVVDVVPVGELDVATVARLDAELRELLEAGFRRFVLDLRKLTFMDSSGLRLILTVHELARSDGLEVTLVPGPDAVQRVFEICGIVDQLPFRSP